jgi:hypothetical protein
MDDLLVEFQQAVTHFAEPIPEWVVVGKVARVGLHFLQFLPKLPAQSVQIHQIGWLICPICRGTTC